ncbi:MAG: cellulase family glycosylhydrolase, partial [Lachnospiraceae bacterium]|nr:cellulase family glycosylhydrolase [Lachnospiraceae bacterium]
WSQEVDMAAADPKKTDDNVVYALHFYAATHKDDLRNKMVKAVKAGLPVFVSEFGICDASGNGSVDEKSANTWIKQLDKYGISYVCWNLANKNESSSLFLSSCSKTSGFTSSDLSDEGKWLKKVLTKRAGKKLEFEDIPKDTKDTKETKEIAKDTKKADISGESGDLAYTAAFVNSWEENGKTNTQYTVSVTNKGSAVDNWEINITFGGKIKLNNSWNCTASAEGEVLTIRNTEYGGRLEKNATVSDIGVIIIEQ